MMDPGRLLAAYEKARLELLAERQRAGHWVGELSTSALSTATAVSALALVDRHGRGEVCGPSGDEAGQSPSRLVVDGIQWLAGHQNADGGWGDTDQSYSNIATTMLAVAALHLAGAAGPQRGLLERAGRYLESQGRIAGLRRRYGKDKTFAVPILTNCALAGLVSWREVAPLPFELACVPQRLYRFLRLPVVSYAIPALVAVGQARYFHRKPLNPFSRLCRAAAVPKSLEVLQRMQPESGGYLEAVPLTSFVVMCLAATGRARHAVSRQGVEFLRDSVRPDGSWPIDTNLATWNTTLALNALAGAGEDIARLGCLEWLLSCQHHQAHAFTGAEPGGWGWTDLSGAVPDTDDTSGALLALAAWYRAASCPPEDRRRIVQAARAGLHWLLDLQNADGGWPTFCRGWGTLPFDRSGTDLTAHALRALHGWQQVEAGGAKPDQGRGSLPYRMQRAMARGLAYLDRRQNADGSWVPLWFGNQDHPQEENPVYGTAKVLLAYRDLGQPGARAAQQGWRWLRDHQNPDGGWGGGPALDRNGAGQPCSSVEETAVALEALLGAADDRSLQRPISQGLEWLVRAVQANGHRKSAPIGFYFAKLWYHEQLYPLTFTVSALGQALRRVLPRVGPKPAMTHLPPA